MRNALQEEIDAFHKKIRARALLIAVEWAGSAAQLSLRIGGSRYTGAKWVQRGHIPIPAALNLESLPGFPLTAEEMCAGTDISTHRKKCPHCWRKLLYAGQRAGYPSILKVARKRAKQEAARKPTPKAAHKPAKPKAVRKQPPARGGIFGGTS